MLRNKKVLIILTLVILLGVTAWSVAAGTIIDQKSVLTGTVLAQNLPAPGVAVREGNILAYVDTVTGPAVAVRANTDGVVRDVLVRPGDRIKTGDVLIRLESTKR
ncbi:MAG TPA: biotin/lipoyl-binding protein [Patescibacteria group bacterium]|nr:biotin/lipoyl-binding protein [Patescibacteria group bacterium]